MPKRSTIGSVKFIINYATNVYGMKEITPAFVYGWLVGLTYPARGITTPLTIQQVQKAMYTLGQQGYIRVVAYNYISGLTIWEVVKHA